MCDPPPPTLDMALAERPAAPLFTLPRYQIQAAVALACSFDLDDTAVKTLLKGSNILEQELRPADVSRFLHEAALKG